MTGMRSHGRHRHRASTRTSTEAGAADSGTSGSAGGGAVGPFGTPEWRAGRARDVAGSQVWRSEVDRVVPGERDGGAVDGGHAVPPQQGLLGWDGTLAGRGALDEIGFGGSGAGTAEHWLPHLRQPPGHQPALAPTGWPPAGADRGPVGAGGPPAGRHAAAPGTTAPGGAVPGTTVP